MPQPEKIQFDMPKKDNTSSSIIMVTGVGGGGSNAVNHMFDLGIPDVSFMVCNTDRQALSRSPVPIKVRLGENLTQGLGAGNNPDRGREAALETLDEMVEIYKREETRMVFITAGMGGGTGTGAAPVIAKATKEMGILTVAIVTLPFRTEGPKRMKHAYEGIQELRKYVDSLVLINNENILEIYGDLALSEAFGKVDDILATAAGSIARLIMTSNLINVDFADVETVMRDSGIALMGSARASGEDRVMKVADAALSSPLLNNNNITGARNALINIISGKMEETKPREVDQIMRYIQDRAGNEVDIIWGAGTDEEYGQDIEVTIIATGFDADTLLHPSDREKNGLPATESPVKKQPAPTEKPATPQGGNPLHSRPGFNRPVPVQQKTQGAVPDGTQAVVPQRSQPSHPVAASRVIEVKRSNSNFNVDELEDEPAYVRRKIEFVKERFDEGERAPRNIVLKDDVPQNDNVEGGSLFD